MEIPTPRGLRSLVVLLFTVCPILFFTDLTRNPYYTQIALLNIFVPAAWLLVLVQALRSRELIWVASDLDTPLLFLFGICLASWGASFIWHRPFVKSIYSEGSRAFIFLIVNTYLAYALALRSQDQTFFKRLLWITYAVSVFASVYAVAQYFGTEWFWPRNLNPYGSRPVGTFGNPNFLSSYLVLVIPVMVADYLSGATRLPRAFLFGGILCNLAALLATLTRSSWAGLGVALGVFLWRSRPALSGKGNSRKLLWILLVAMGLLVWAWPKADTATYSETVFGRLAEVRRATKETYGPVSQRLLIWSSAWSMLEDHPILGKGWGSFELFYPFYQGPLLLEEAFKTLRTHANNAHNEILEYASQTGLAGLGCVIWLWIVFLRNSLSISERNADSPWKMMPWALASGVAGMLADNLLNVSVHFAVPAFVFWWWVGSVFLFDPAARKVHRWELRAPWRFGALVLAALVLIGFAGRSVCLWAGEVNFFRGFKLSKGGVDLVGAKRYLEEAHSWHRMEVNNNYELANVHARLAEKDQALRMYQEALDANAGYDEIYFNRATMHMQLGQADEAIRYYRICLAINPLSHEAYNALASLYLKDMTHYGEDTEKLYRQGTRAFPRDRDMWNNLGYLYTQQKQWQKAYDAYAKALEVDPAFELAQRNLQVVARQLRSPVK